MTWPPRPPRYSAAVQAKIDALSQPQKKRRPRVMREQALQIEVADFLRLAVSRPARWWFCPNGGNLSKAQRGVFKRMGLTPGVPDLHFAWSNLFPYFGVIELKAGKGDTSEEQDDFLADMASLGHQRAVCWSLEEVVDTLTGWGFPLSRAALAALVLHAKGQ